ncbi:MAG: DUF1292 domain-containing protein [Lachnospiraceae bacterium]|nr:DUF1292 domain-containing protein [Lachnospiraceae bacterium]
MEKIAFTLDSGETAEFYVLEQAKLSGNNYILVTEEEEGDAEALILREIQSQDKKETGYEIVDDDNELEALSSLFESLLEDIEIE